MLCKLGSSPDRWPPALLWVEKQSIVVTVVTDSKTYRSYLKEGTPTNKEMFKCTPSFENLWRFTFIRQPFPLSLQCLNCTTVAHCTTPQISCLVRASCGCLMAIWSTRNVSNIAYTWIDVDSFGVPSFRQLIYVCLSMSSVTTLLCFPESWRSTSKQEGPHPSPDRPSLRLFSLFIRLR